LVAGLAERWSEPGGDPFVVHLVCGPSRGTSRWLAQELSRRLGARAGDDGVCAGVDFMSLDQLVAQVVAAALQDGRSWSGDSLVQGVLGALQDSADEPWFALLGRHLGTVAERPRRRARLARRLAGLIERYLAWAPEMVAAWWRDQPAPQVAAGDSDAWMGAAAEDPTWWQAGLVRAVAARLGDPPLLDRSVLEGLERDDPLPTVGRVALFCPDSVSPLAATVLRAVSWHHPVDLFSRVLPGSAVGRSLTRAGADVDRVLDALAGEGREPTAGGTSESAAGGTSEPVADGTSEPAVGALSGGRGQTALGAVQAALMGDAPPLRGGGDDGTLQLHASHGPDRQAEVLRDLLLGLLADDASLEPRHILVVCPRLEAFQGWLEAVFGPTPVGVEWDQPGHVIRVSLAGSRTATTNHVIDAIGALLDLIQSRASASQLLALATNPAVATRFGWTADDCDRLTDLVHDSGLRWGLSAAGREPYGLAGFAENTWSAGLNRLVLGVAAPPDQLIPVGPALPLETVGADQAGLVGSLLELTGRVRRLAADWGAGGDGRLWGARLRGAVDLLTAVEPDDNWQLTEALGLAQGLADAAGEAGPRLELADAAALWEAGRERRRSRERLLNGDLTIAAPSDLHHVPHRVVCWVGLDADSFPRRHQPDGDDLLDVPGAAGPPDIAWLDRQVLADSLLDASDRFLIVYRGHDPRDNTLLAPPAPVLDLLALAARTLGDEAARNLVHHHPAHPFSLIGRQSDETAETPRPPGGDRPDDGTDPTDRPAWEAPDSAPSPVPAGPSGTGGRKTVGSLDLIAGGGGDGGWTFDARAVAATRRLAAPSPPPGRPALGEGPPPPAELTIDALARALAQPAAHYLRWRTGLTASLLPGEPEATADFDAVPLDPDGLGRWQITQRLLRLARAGHDPAAIWAAEPLRGELPPKGLGRPVLEQCWRAAQDILAAAARYEAEPELWRAVDLGWPGLPRLIGQVATRGDVVLTVQAGRAQPRGQLTAWVTLLALQAAAPERAWRAVIVGRRSQVELTAGAPDRAAAGLRRLLELHLAAGREPLPLPCSTGLWASLSWRRGQEPDPAELRRRWSQEWGQDAAWRTVQPQPEAVLTAVAQASDWPFPGSGPRTRFEALGRQVYLPLLEAGARVPSPLPEAS
jgi:exodeoxyribonuclease V gamma subunit